MTRTLRELTLAWQITLVGMISLMLAGCGGSDAVKPAKLPEFKPTAQAQVAWRASVGGSKSYIFSPALAQGAIFAAGADGTLARFDAANGKQVWRVNSGVRLSAGVAVDDDLVLVAGNKGDVLAYGLDGKERWRAKVTSEVLSPPRASGSIVVVRSGDGRIFGLDATSGERQWQYQATMTPLLLRAQPGVSIIGSAVLVGLPAGKVMALNLATGIPLWSATVAQPKGANELERITDVAAPPLVDHEQACAVAYQGRIACYDVAKGTLEWSRDASSAAGLATDAVAVYMTDENGAVMAFDKASGATLWKQDKLFARQVSGPAVRGSLIVVGDYEGYVHFLERADGAFVVRVSTDGSRITTPPLTVGSNVLVQTRDGGLYAIEVK